MYKYSDTSSPSKVNIVVEGLINLCRGLTRWQYSFVVCKNAVGDRSEWKGSIKRHLFITRQVRNGHCSRVASISILSNVCRAAVKNATINHDIVDIEQIYC